MVPCFRNPGRFGSKNRRFCLISRRNRQLGLGIEEMQTAGLRRQADLIAARNRGAMQGPEKQNAPDPENRGRCAFEQGLLPCQFIVRCWLPVF